VKSSSFKLTAAKRVMAEFNGGAPLLNTSLTNMFSVFLWWSSDSYTVRQSVQSVNREIGKNAHKSNDAWVLIASSVQSRREAH